MRNQKLITTAGALRGNGTAPPPDLSVVPLDETALAGGPELPAVTPYADLEQALGLDDDGISVAEVLVTVACRKPRSTEFFMVHPDEGMSRACYVFVDKETIGGRPILSYRKRGLTSPSICGRYC